MYVCLSVFPSPASYKDALSGVVAYACAPSSLADTGGALCQGPAWATEEDSVSENQKNKISK